VPDIFANSLILFLVGLVAGALNVIAGGGSLISLPVMIFLGLPPTVANGTNRVAILVQNIGASWSFHRRGLISTEWLLLAVPPALIGAALGTFAAVHIGELAFQRILAVVLVAAAAWTIWRPIDLREESQAELPTGTRRWLYIAAFFLIGVYGGFIQAGIGFLVLAITSAAGLNLIKGNALKVTLVLTFMPLSLLLLAITSAAGLNLIKGNALKVTLVLTFMPLSLLLFALNGKVEWAMGLALAAGNFLGGLAGVHLQVLKGHTWVRGVVTVTIIIFAARLLFTVQ
jgi:uncharacterized membrane protein YfcA